MPLTNSTDPTPSSDVSQSTHRSVLGSEIPCWLNTFNAELSPAVQRTRRSRVSLRARYGLQASAGNHQTRTPTGHARRPRLAPGYRRLIRAPPPAYSRRSPCPLETPPGDRSAAQIVLAHIIIGPPRLSCWTGRDCDDSLCEVSGDLRSLAPCEMMQNHPVHHSHDERSAC